VIMNNVSCLNNFFTGLIHLNATNTTIDACHFDNTFSDDPGRATSPAYDVLIAWGANFVNSGNVFADYNTLEDPNILNMTISNSTFNNTILKGDFTTIPRNPFFTVAGMILVRGKGIECRNCQFNGSTNLFAPPSATTVGAVCGSLEDSTFINCHFDDVTSLGSINGFHLSGVGPGVPTKSSRNTRLINCTANNLQNIGDQQLPAPILGSLSVTGFQLSFTKDITLDGCISQDLVMRAPQVNRTGNVVGFMLSGTANQVPPLPDATVENVVYRNCIASRCFALNGGSAAGFDLQTTVGTGRDTLKSVVLENCISSGNETFTPILTTPGIVQGCGFGFVVLDENQTTPEQFQSFPMVFNGCIALHNKGLPSTITITAALNPVYSSGFYLWNTVRAALKDCITEDNVYGFFLNQCDRCTVRDCQADNNVDLIFVPGTGAGFTDVGTPGIPAGRLGTPASPGLSTSVFESNRAFANGANVDIGANGNYNVLYGTGLVPLPILTGNLTTPSFPTGGTSFQPTINISMTR
jgi:parallel beta-helix repeat protein